jgi:hypothetical protein
MINIETSHEAMDHILSKDLQDDIVARADAYLNDGASTVRAKNDQHLLLSSPYGKVVQEIGFFFARYDRTTGLDKEGSDSTVGALRLGMAFVCGAVHRTKLGMQLDEFSEDMYKPGFLVDRVNHDDNAQLADVVYRMRNKMENRAWAALAHLTEKTVERIEDVEESFVADINAQRIVRVGAGLALYDLVYADIWTLQRQYESISSAQDDAQQWDISELEG